MNRKLFLLALLIGALAYPAFGEVGVTRHAIRVGSVLALQGKAAGLGKGMEAGLQAAFKGVKVHGRSITLIARNDSYEPTRAKKETQALVSQGVFAMIGNVGTPTAMVTLPVLKEHDVPAVGFFTGAGVLRPGAGGPIINYRASYTEETAEVINAAIKAGLHPDQVCAFVQNDGYGMSGLTGIKRALRRYPEEAHVIKLLDEIIAMPGTNPARNGKGPVGVYVRNNIAVNPGYASLKAWEKSSGHPCKLIVTVGAYATIGHFVQKASHEGEKWIISAVSFTGAGNLRRDLEKYGTTQRVVMTQVVPLPQSRLPIVSEAKRELGHQYGIVSEEGYIVGKMFVHILRDVKGPLTRSAFMRAARHTRFNLGGVHLDLTRSNQASNLVVLSELTHNGWRPANEADLKAMLR